jgi:hypothetical protein
MRRRFFALVVAAIASTFAFEMAEAEWTQFQRDEFNSGCVPACRNNPSLPGHLTSRCEAYCTCVMLQGESRFSSAEYEMLERDTREKRRTPLLEEFSKLSRICNQRIFSN